MSLRKLEIHNSVRFVGHAIGSQSEHVLSTNSDVSYDSAKKTQQNKRSLNQNNRNFSKKLTGKGFNLFNFWKADELLHITKGNTDEVI